jgi:hypothetical protein
VPKPHFGAAAFSEHAAEVLLGGKQDVARYLFFEAKAELESRGIVFYTEAKQLTLDRDKALDFMVTAYPGLPIAHDTSLQAGSGAQTYGQYANLSNVAGS